MECSVLHSMLIPWYATLAPPYLNLETTNNFNKAWLSDTLMEI